MLPILNEFPDYSLHKLRGDVVSGITIAIILIPQGLAYGQLAGLPSIWGLWCGLMPLIPYALLAPSPHLSLGPFAICSLLTSQALLTVTDCNVNPDESPSLPNCDEDTKYLHACTVLTFLVGTTELVLSFLSAGEAVARILSVPVTKAYCSACAFYIATSQIKNFLEVSIRSTNSPLALFGAWSDMVDHIEDSNLHSLIFGLVSIVIMLVCKHFSPRFPIELVVVILGITLCWGLHYDDDMSVVGKFNGLPKFAVPKIQVFAADLFPHSIIVTLITYIISISIVKNFSMKHNYPVRGNAHLFALGVANVFGSFFKCYPASGSLSRSVALEDAGARTNVSSLVTALILLFTLLCLTSLFQDLPKSILAAIIFVALKNMFLRVRVGFDLFFSKRQYFDASVWWITFVATLLVGMQFGVIIGMGASILALLVQLRSKNALDRTLRRILKEICNGLKSQPLCRFAIGCCGKQRRSDPLTEPLKDTVLRRQSRIEHTKIDGAHGLRIVTFSFDVPLCFLNIDSFRAEFVSALDNAHQDLHGEEEEEKKEDGDEIRKNVEERETVLIVNFQNIDFVDESAMSIIEQIVSDIDNRSDTVRLYFVACSDEIEEQMRKSAIWEKVGKNFFVDSITRAMSCVQQGIVRTSRTSNTKP